MNAIGESRSRPDDGFEAGWSEITVIETRATSFSPFALASSWRPAVNAYRCARQFIIIADLAGIPPETITVGVEPRRVAIRGSRPVPEPQCESGRPAQLLALEIDHGAFERVLDLPLEIDPDDITTEYRDGLLRIELPLKA